MKYARREDVILHALELENAHLDKESLTLCSKLDQPGSEHGESARELPFMSNSKYVTGDLSDSITILIQSKKCHNLLYLLKCLISMGL